MCVFIRSSRRFLMPNSWVQGPKQKPVLCIPKADIQEPALHKGAFGV